MLAVTSVAGQRGGPPQPPPTPRAAAPFDITGQWVAVVNEDWRYRMTVPPKGDYAGVPFNPNGRRAADAGIRRATRRRASSAAPTARPA